MNSNLMNSDMWGQLIEAVKCYAPAEYEIDFLDDLDGQCVVNVVVNKNSIDLDMAIDRCWKLGKIVKTILNQYDTSDDTMEWFMYNEPSFWKDNGEECYDEWIIENGGIIQYCIYKERK